MLVISLWTHVLLNCDEFQSIQYTLRFLGLYSPNLVLKQTNKTDIKDVTESKAGTMLKVSRGVGMGC